MRWLCVLLISCAVAPALAQSSGDSPRQFEAGKNADLENWAWRARRGRQLTEVEQAVQAVLDAVAKRDCTAAAAKLNAGLAKGYPEIVTMAGGTEASVSARLRDFRKAKFGGSPDAVDRRRRGEAKRGLHEYRLAAEDTGALLRIARGDK